jgi:signal transduction histidine kinase/ActR/RegA family two-component response regulator
MRLKSLLEISQKAGELSEREIIQHTLEEVVRLTESEIGYLHFVNDDQESIHLFAWSEDALRECTATHDSHYPISRAGVWADCARLKKPVVHNDYQNCPDKRGYPEGHSHLIRHASIPIVDDENVVIVLGVGNKQGDYDDADIRQMLLAADGLWKILLRKRAEEELRQHVRYLEAADRQKDEFLAMLAHELRNPLAPISTAMQILDQQDVDPALVREAAKVIGRQVEHLTHLVDDLLDVSRITRGKIELKRERLDLVEVVNGAIEVNRDVITVRRHQLSVSQPATEVAVFGDRVRLTQVVGNLLHNAAKYMPDNGQIELTLDESDGHAVICVQDEGIGIAPSMLPRVFDLFVQADQSLDRSQGGLGLGLTLVRQLVELHGGTVEALSDGLNRGSKFVVRLPLIGESQRQSDSTPGASAVATRSAAFRILIVDDNQDAASMLAALLGTMGHQVEKAHDGRAALDVLESFRPDVVLLDIGLPKVDGYQVAEQIRLKYTSQEVLLIAVTGYGHPQAIQRGRDVGFDHHLLKPLNPRKLVELLAGYHKRQLGKHPE